MAAVPLPLFWATGSAGLAAEIKIKTAEKNSTYSLPVEAQMPVLLIQDARKELVNINI